MTLFKYHKGPRFPSKSSVEKKTWRLLCLSHPAEASPNHSKLLETLFPSLSTSLSLETWRRFVQRKQPGVITVTSRDGCQRHSFVRASLQAVFEWFEIHRWNVYNVHPRIPCQKCALMTRVFNPLRKCVQREGVFNCIDRLLSALELLFGNCCVVSSWFNGAVSKSKYNGMLLWTKHGSKPYSGTNAISLRVCSLIWLKGR